MYPIVGEFMAANANNDFSKWLKNNRAMAVEALRIYFGMSLFFKGLWFISNPAQAHIYMEMIDLPFLPFLSIHVIAFAHLAFGLLLALGCITRIASLIQVPILLGAVFFVHWPKEALFMNQDLEYVILVLVLLLFFSIYGGGSLSVDHKLFKKIN